MLRLAARTPFGPRRSLLCLSLILLAVAFCSALHSIATPFWFDEVCTVIMCRLPSASQLWKALSNAADGNPPAFFLVARWTRHLVSDDHLAYRLPSILGLLATLVLIYGSLSRRVQPLSALVGAAFLLCTPLATYAYEARPYALAVACISAALFAWQTVDDSLLSSLGLAGALAAAISLHYYAILVWPVFCASRSLSVASSPPLPH
jgi:hypothetical protein